jgi:hypothetical protein
MDIVARQEKGSPKISSVSAVSPALTSAVGSQYTPTEYERTTYYNGISGASDHPKLIYRSDFLTEPFPKPAGRFAHIPVKSLRGVHDTPLNGVWETVGPKIVDLITTRKIKWSSVDPARFFTHATPGEEEKGRLGPVVIWLGVNPGSTDSDTAHEVSQEILALLREHHVEDAVVEWREAILQRLAGPALMRHVGSTNPTYHVRRFLTALLGMPLSTQGMEAEDSQGTLTLWFHETETETEGKDGNTSPKVYGVSTVMSFARTPPSTTSTNVAHPRTLFGFADCVDSSGGSMRLRSISVTTGFAPRFTHERSMGWRRWRIRMRGSCARSTRLGPS